MTQWTPPTQGMQGMNAGVRPHRGVMILVFGILGLVFCIVFGIIAWVMGSGDLKQMAAGAMDKSGEGLTRAGMICGIVGVALNVLAILIWIVIMVVAVGAGVAASGAGGSGAGP